jgi:hypothetical protein
MAERIRYARYELINYNRKYSFAIDMPYRMVWAWFYKNPDKDCELELNEVDHLYNEQYTIVNGIYHSVNQGEEDDYYLNELSEYCLNL